MKQKDFVFNICLLVFLNLLVKPFWILGIDVGVQNSVGTENYGLYFAVFNFTYLFNMLLDMGITNFNNRNIAQNPHLLAKHFSGIVTLKFLLGLSYLAIVLAVGLFIGYRDLHLKLLFWTAINQFLNTFILYLRSNVAALMLFKTDSCLSITDKLLMIALCSALLWGNVTSTPFRIEWFVYAQTTAYVLTALIALAVVIIKGKPQRPCWDFAFFTDILKQSLPFALLYFLMSFYNRVDSVMLERILPEDIATYQAGIYASAFRLLDALVMISYLFSVILLPLFSKMIKEKEDLKPIVKTSFCLLFFFSATVAILLYFFREPVLDLLYDEHVTESAEVFKVLIFGLIPISLAYLFGTLLTARGDMKKLNVVAGIGIAVNIAVNVLLIPEFHACGAAIASLATQSVVTCSQILIVFRTFDMPLKELPLISSGLYVMLLIAASILMLHYGNGILSPVLMLALLSARAVGFAFATRLLSLKDIFAFGKNSGK